MSVPRPNLDMSRSSTQIQQGDQEMLTTKSEMLTRSLFVRLDAKPGKEEEVAAFLKQGLELANQEATTPLWFALRLGPAAFAIFDAFGDEGGRQSHLNGPIAKALLAQAPTLFVTPPVIEHMEVLGVKLPEAS
jgi:quinol monooxygenase YgiN